MKYGEKLTQQDLLDWGFYELQYFSKEESPTGKDFWIMKRRWNSTRNPNAKPTEHEIKVSYTHDKHTYGLDYKHPVVNFSVRGKQMCIPLGRFIFAFLDKEVPAGYKVAHTGKDLSKESFELKSIYDNEYRNINNQYTVSQISSILDKNFKKYEFCEAVERNIKILHKWAGKE